MTNLNIGDTIRLDQVTLDETLELIGDKELLIASIKLLLFPTRCFKLISVAVFLFSFKNFTKSFRWNFLCRPIV